MGISEVKSPWSHSGGRATGADRPVGQSPISTPRADAGGHVLRHVGKSPITPARLMRQDEGDFVNFPPGEGNRFKA
jgi:hypothetical protein